MHAYRVVSETREYYGDGVLCLDREVWAAFNRPFADAVFDYQAQWHSRQFGPEGAQEVGTEARLSIQRLDLCDAWQFRAWMHAWWITAHEGNTSNADDCETAGRFPKEYRSVGTLAGTEVFCQAWAGKRTEVEVRRIARRAFGRQRLPQRKRRSEGKVKDLRPPEPRTKPTRRLQSPLVAVLDCGDYLELATLKTKGAMVLDLHRDVDWALFVQVIRDCDPKEEMYAPMLEGLTDPERSPARRRRAS